MSCGVGCRCGSDLALMWLWHRPGATASSQPLAWGPPYATGAALKKRQKKRTAQAESWSILKVRLQEKETRAEGRLPRSIGRWEGGVFRKEEDQPSGLSMARI